MFESVKALIAGLITMVIVAAALGAALFLVVGDREKLEAESSAVTEPATPALKLIQVIDGDKVVFQMVFEGEPGGYLLGRDWFDLESPDGDQVALRPGADDLVVVTNFDPEKAREAAAKARAQQEHGEPDEDQ